MVALSAAALVVSLSLTAGRARDVPRAASWDQILSGFSVSPVFGPTFPLPLGPPPGVRFGLRMEFRLNELGPAEMGLVLPVFGRWQAEGDSSSGGAELMPAIALSIRPFAGPVRLSVEGGFGFLLQTKVDSDGASDATALAARVSMPLEVRLAPRIWLMVMPSLLRNLTYSSGYLEVMAGVSWRYE
jgi:hypothetical protein